MQQRVQFVPRLHVLLASVQHGGVVGPRCLVVRRQLQDRFQQPFGLIQDVSVDADAGQQAQRFGIFTVLTQVGTQEVFRPPQFAIAEQAAGLHDGSWNLL